MAVFQGFKTFIVSHLEHFFKLNISSSFHLSLNSLHSNTFIICCPWILSNMFAKFLKLHGYSTPVEGLSVPSGVLLLYNVS